MKICDTVHVAGEKPYEEYTGDKSENYVTFDA